MKKDNLILNYESERLLIIGNGFDLSLGLKTRFSDFANSECWPFTDSRAKYFHAYLNDKKSTETWFDLERILGEYEESMGKVRPIDFRGSNYRPTPIDDYKSFRELSISLVEYLKEQQETELNVNSVAAKILRSIVANGFFQKVISFNYTNLVILAKKIGFEIRPDIVEYIHGNLKDGIVLGVPENVHLTYKYDFLYKTSSANYSSHPLPHYLDTASEIVFFGHSLSDNDYFYFKRFFEQQSAQELIGGRGKYITIFTYDDKSRLAIIRQLRKHLNDRLPLLYALNKFDVIRTDGSDEKKIEDFIKRQKDTNTEKSILPV